ncbi:MAG: hypothetical protein ABIN35_00495 [candidate division WOR-3 bacterium]
MSFKISIDGNVCSGKSFYLKKLTEKGYRVHYNDQSFPRMTPEYCRQSLLNYLNVKDQPRCHNSHDPTQWLDFYEGSPLTVRNIDQSSDITDDRTSKIVVDVETSNERNPDIIIYLFCLPQVCFERYVTRLIDSAKDINNSYRFYERDFFQHLHLKYECLYDDVNCSIPIYKINSQEDPSMVLNNIEDIIQQIYVKS